MRLPFPDVVLTAATAWLLLAVAYFVGTHVSCEESTAAQDAASVRGLYVMLAATAFAWGAVVATVRRLRSRREAAALAVGGIATAVSAPFLELLTVYPIILLLAVSVVFVRTAPPELERARIKLWLVSAGWFLTAPLVAVKMLTHCGLTLF